MPSNTSDIPTEFRYYGGSRFDTDNLKEEQWLPYGDDFFVLPRIELVCSKEPDWTESEISTERSGPRHMSAPCYWLAVNCCVLGSQLAENGWSSEISAALIAAENIRQASSRREIPAKLPPIVEKIESLSPDEWASAYESISAKIQAGTLARMELERKTSADFATEVEALDLLFLLKQRDAGRFCLQLDAETALLDCSVGPVYRVSGGSIETRVIAATRPRGCTAEEDVAQADGFFLDGGEDSAAAAAALKRASELLAAFGGDVRVSDPFVVTSRHAQQLCRAVRARAPGPSPKNAWPAATALLRPGGGRDAGAAAAAVRSAEGFDRGFVGGRVGFFSAHAGAFVCPSRSVLCRPLACHVYSAELVAPGRPAVDAWAAAGDGVGARAVLQAARAGAPGLAGLPNVNALWATLLVEELVREMTFESQSESLARGLASPSESGSDTRAGPGPSGSAGS